MPTSLLAIQWGAPSLRAQLEPVWPGLSVEVVERAVSTNTTLLDRARAAFTPEPHDGMPAIVRRSVESAAFGRRAVEPPPCLLVAEQQAGGRGRQGRTWQSAPGASLTFSLAVTLAVSDWSGLSLAVGVALADALDPRTCGAAGADSALRIGLKWPNDLWCVDRPGAGRKLGGILIETVVVGAHRVAVVGIGLNVRPMALSDSPTDSPSAVGRSGSGFASLYELDPAATAPAVLRQVALPLARALRQFESEGFAPFAARFAARDLLRGQPVRTTQPDVPEGIAQGVSTLGALLVQTPAGLKAVSSGEVSVRPIPPADRPHESQTDALVAPPSC
jgi:BirA family biotin operon repressor/biotin-[acetyl-CoA-carboxylase] ligase